MTKTFISYEDDHKNNKQVILLLLFLMLCFGIYKNGFKYYQSNLLRLSDISKIIAMPLLSLLYTFIYTRFIKKETLKVDDLIESLLLTLILPVRFPIALYAILLAIYFICKYLLQEKINTISIMCFYKVLIVICNFFFNINYENLIESSNPYFYGIVDTLFGNSVGGLGSTNIFLIIILFLVMQNNFYYKKNLVFYMLMPFFLLTIFYEVITSGNIILTNLINSDVLFASVIFLPECSKSPSVPNYAKIYACLIGICTFIIVTLCKFTDGVYLIIFIFQIIWTVFLNLKIKNLQKS